MSKKANVSVVLLFVVFLALVFALNLFTPDKSFSEKENRYLQKLPSFSFSSLFDGEYTPRMENYCSDQFIGRDFWISLKARLELLQGKKENNGVFLCRDERLIVPVVVPESSALDRQIGCVNALTDNIDVPVTLGLIPTSAQLYGELLPDGVRNDDQRAAIDYVYSRVQASHADLLTALERRRDEYIFYRTDHHWTSLGALEGYGALAEALGLEKKTGLREAIVSDTFLGTAYSSSGFFWVRPDSISTLVDAPSGVTVERYETEEPVPGALYAEEMLQTKDKYRFFLGGNVPRAVIRTGNEGLPSLLILRDSFADSLVPFLLDHYSEIHLLDLRYYRDPVSEYVRDRNIDAVLVLYSADDFFTSPDLGLLKR